MGSDAGKQTVADGPGATIGAHRDQSYPGKLTNMRWHRRPLLEPRRRKNAPLRVEKRLRTVVPMGRNRVGPLPRNRVVPFRRNQGGPITRNPATDPRRDISRWRDGRHGGLLPWCNRTYEKAGVGLQQKAIRKGTGGSAHRIDPSDLFHTINISSLHTGSGWLRTKPAPKSSASGRMQ